MYAVNVNSKFRPGCTVSSTFSKRLHKGGGPILQLLQLGLVLKFKGLLAKEGLPAEIDQGNAYWGRKQKKKRESKT
jgi:hypothetical protein